MFSCLQNSGLVEAWTSTFYHLLLHTNWGQNVSWYSKKTIFGPSSLSLSLSQPAACTLHPSAQARKEEWKEEEGKGRKEGEKRKEKKECWILNFWLNVCAIFLSEILKQKARSSELGGRRRGSLARGSARLGSKLQPSSSSKLQAPKEKRLFLKDEFQGDRVASSGVVNLKFDDCWSLSLVDDRWREALLFFLLLVNCFNREQNTINKK